MRDSLPQHFASWQTAARSWWQENVPEGAVPRELERLPERVDTVIVGLGVAGAALALELVSQGADPESLVAVDAAGPGFGASGRNAGFVLSLPATEPLDWIELWGRDTAIRLIRENVANRELVADFARAHGVSRQEGGSYSCGQSDEEHARFRATAAFLKEAGVAGYEYLETLPGPAEGFYRGCIHQAQDLGIHPVEYVLRMLAASSVPIVSDCPLSIRDFVSVSDGVRIHTPKGTVNARRVLLATNAYVGFFLGEGAAFPVMAIRNQVVLGNVEGQDTNALWGDGVYYANDGFDYWRQLPDGRLLIGGARNVDLEGEQTADMLPNPKVLEYLEGTLARRLTGGRHFEPLHRWQGVIGSSPDLLPMAGWVPGWGNRLFYMGGFSGYGLGFHRIVARRVAEHLRTGSPLGPFCARRLETRRAARPVARRFAPGTGTP